MDQEYETMSPPGSPSGRSGASANLSARQYFCVNLSKFVIELIGTAVFTMMFYMLNGRYSSIMLSLWVITLFGLKISGAHYNPCITLAQMVRRSSSFGRRRLKGIMYIWGQLLGGILGACAIATLLKEGSDYRINVMPTASGCEYVSDWRFSFTNPEGEFVDCRYDIPDPADPESALPNENRHWKTFQSIISETLGTFIYVLFFMICTDDKLKYSNDPVKNGLVIASSYIAAQLMAGGQYITFRTGPCLNPAVALGLAIFQANFNFPQYLICPWVGCILSVIFYEFVFVKTQEYLADDDSEIEEDDEEEEEEDASPKNKAKAEVKKQEVLSDD